MAKTATKKRAKTPKPRATNAIAKSASGAPDDLTIRDTQPPPFEPTAKQLAYLFSMRDALVPSGDRLTSDVAMAKKVKVSRQTIYEWKQDPEFRTWLSGQLGVEQESIKWFLMLETHYELGIRGSVRSAEFIGRVRSVGIKGGGFTDGGDQVDQSVTNYTVISLVPRPPALPEKTVGGGQV